MQRGDWNPLPYTAKLVCTPAIVNHFKPKKVAFKYAL